MIFTIVLINGREYDVSQEERDMILGKTGMVFIPSLNVTINMSSVSCIEQKGQGKAIDRSKQLVGVMPDGEVIVKRFGRWYFRDCNEYQRDDDGNPIREAFPELGVAPTPEEFEQKFQHLPSAEWAKLLCGDNSERPQHQLENRGATFLDKELFDN